jgi:TonB family protein
MLQGCRAGLIVVCAVGVALAAFANRGGAQEITPRPVPTPVICARPNVAASVVRAEPVVAPALAQQQGIQGQVQVVVSLDADSRVIGTRIQSSPSAVLNAAALAAARQSTFQTAIRDCRPVPGDYLYTVDFTKEVTVSVTSSGEQVVSVVGVGLTTRQPDEAVVQARIATYADTTAVAKAKNDATLRALVAKLRPLGIAGGKIRATSSGLRALQSPPAASAYSATRDVEIWVDTVADAGHAAAAAASIETIDPVSIRYTLHDRVPAFRQALDAALKDAENGARLAVTNLGRRLGVVKQVVVVPDDSSRPLVRVVPYHLIPVIGGFNEPVVRAPDLEVHATATVTYAVQS